MENEKRPDAIEIPMEAVDQDTLLTIVEEFILREGTDYGANEVSLPKKVEQVLQQMQRGDVKLFFEPESESVTLVKVKRSL